MPAREVALLILLASGLPLGQASAQPAAADDAEADQHFDRGAALATEQKYEEAAAEFRAAYRLRPRKEALFAWAQVLRLGGDCPGAVELYRKFLGSPDLTPTQIEAAQLSVDRCLATPSPRPAAPAIPPPVLVAPAPVAVVTPEPQRGRRAVVVGASLLGASVVALGASGTFFVLSRNDERAALAADTWGDYRDPAARARTRQRWAFGFLGGGVLLAGAAVVEWLATTPARDKGPEATAWIGGGGAGVGIRGRY